MSVCLSKALLRFQVIHGLSDVDMAEIGEVSVDTIKRARKGKNTGWDGITRLSKRLAERHHLYDIALCSLPEGFRVVPPVSSDEADDSVDDNWAKASVAFSATREAYGAGDWDRADSELDALLREVYVMREEIAKKRREADRSAPRARTPSPADGHPRK